jgi:TonB family protein
MKSSERKNNIILGIGFAFSLLLHGSILFFAADAGSGLPPVQSSADEDTGMKVTYSSWKKNVPQTDFPSPKIASALKPIGRRDRPQALPAESGAVSATASGTESLPQPIRLGTKQYPAAAWNRGIEGTVLCLTGFDETGRVVGLNILESPGFGLDEAAREFIMTTVWDPGLKAGKPAACSIVIPVTFRLQDR